MSEGSPGGSVGVGMPPRTFGRPTQRSGRIWSPTWSLGRVREDHLQDQEG